MNNMALWARQALQSGVILDTETTGLTDTDQVIQIGIIDTAGNVLMDQIIRPTCPISLGAARVHGIEATTLTDKPTYREIESDLKGVLANRAVYIYNAEFDLRLLVQTAKAHGCDRNWIGRLPTGCVMKAYTAFLGARRWPKLQGGDHSAVADCRATLAVLKQMAGVQ